MAQARSPSNSGSRSPSPTSSISSSVGSHGLSSIKLDWSNLKDGNIIEISEFLINFYIKNF